MARVAISVGLARYDSRAIQDLPFAENDARAFNAAMLDGKLGQACKQRSRLIVSPSRAELRAQLAEVFSGLRAEDQFILYIAGHASYLTGGRMAFYCRDTDPVRRATTTLSERDLRLIIRYHNTTPGIIILDTCHAASFADLKRNERARGDVDQIEPDEALRGIEVAWACRSREQAFEARGSGLFSGLLLEAIRCGADLPETVQQVGLAKAVTWVQARLRRHEPDHRFWPGWRGIHNLAGLYLCANINAKPERAGESSPAHLERELEHLFGHLRLSADFGHTLGQLAQTVRQTGVLPPGAPGQVLHSTAARMIFYRTIVPAILGPLGLFVLVVAYSRNEAAAIWAAAVPMLLAAVIAIPLTLRTLRNRNAHFLLATPAGFVIAKGDKGASLQTAIFPWRDSVARLEPIWQERKGLTNLIVHLNRPPGRLEFSDVEYEGGLHAVVEMLQTNQRLSNALGPVPEQRGQLPQSIAAVALIAVSAYGSLPALSSPQHDAALMQQALRIAASSVPELFPNPTLGTLEEGLWRLLAAHRGEVVICFFSGHGAVLDGELVLALTDTMPDRLATTSFPVSRLQDMIAEARIRHLVLILDCCFAGAAGEAFGLTISGAGASLDRLFDADQGVISIVAAATDAQFALAMDDKPSLFTAAFTDALGNAGVGSASLEQLAKRASEAVRARDMGQQVWTFLSDEASAIELGVSDPGGQLDLIAARQREQIDQLAPALMEEVHRTGKTIERVIKSDTVYAFTTSKERYKRPATTPWGCLSVVAAVCLIIAWLSFTTQHFENGFGAIVVMAALATVIMVWTAPERYARQTLVVSRHGLLVGGRAIAAVDIAVIFSTVETSAGAINRDIALTLTDRFGKSFVIVKAFSGWSASLDEIHHVMTACIEQDKADAFAQATALARAN